MIRSRRNIIGVESFTQIMNTVGQKKRKKMIGNLSKISSERYLKVKDYTFKKRKRKITKNSPGFVTRRHKTEPDEHPKPGDGDLLTSILGIRKKEEDVAKTPTLTHSELLEFQFNLEDWLFSLQNKFMNCFMKRDITRCLNCEL